MLQVILNYIVIIISVVLVFGLAVFVHEFGHMFFALIRGVGVESFAIGMGPKIVSWKWRGIDFSLRWFPVGGFVKLAGLMPGEAEETAEGPETRAYTPAEQTNSIEMRLEREETIDKLEPIEGKTLAESSYDDMMALSNKGLVTKLLVFGGGVFMNYITAIVAMALLLTLPKKEMVIDPVIWEIEENTPAAAAGFQIGDRIVAVDGRSVRFSHEVSQQIGEILKDRKLYTNQEKSSHALTFTVARGDSTLDLGPVMYGHFAAGTVYLLPPLVGLVHVGQPAQKAGLKRGDRILSINGDPIEAFNDLHMVMSKNGDKEVALEVERTGEEGAVERQTIAITPIVMPMQPERGIMGIEAGAEEYVRLPGEPVLSAVAAAPGRTWAALVDLVDLHIQFFKKATLKQIGQGLGGPVLIARMTASAAEDGLVRVVSFFITLNLLLMVFNLLPLPVLDGGFIMVSIIEAVIRRPVPPKVLAPIYTAFMFFFIGLMLLITVLDVAKWMS